jgi:hypothetical protein
MNTNDLDAILEHEPWLSAFLDDDLDVEAARRRFREGQDVATRSIPPRTRLVRDGVHTTSYAK